MSHQVKKERSQISGFIGWIWGARGMVGTKMAQKLGCRKMFWGGDEKQHMEGQLRTSRERVFQMVGAATAKLREPKHVRTWGTDSKLESDERKLRDGT